MLADSGKPGHHRSGKERALTMRKGLREATMADALTGFFDIASFGFVEHIFRRLSDPGADIAAVLRARLADSASHLPYGKARLTEIDGVAVGLLSGDVVEDLPPQLDSDFPTMLRPIMELEHLAPGTFNACFFAVLPDVWGHGVARALPEDAAVHAPAMGKSLLVHDQNAPARRLYENFGFHEVARRKIIKEGWDVPARDWVLMTRPGGSDAALGWCGMHPARLTGVFLAFGGADRGEGSERLVFHHMGRDKLGWKQSKARFGEAMANNVLIGDAERVAVFGANGGCGPVAVRREGSHLIEEGTRSKRLLDLGQMHRIAATIKDITGEIALWEQDLTFGARAFQHERQKCLYFGTTRCDRSDAPVFADLLCRAPRVARLKSRVWHETGIRAAPMA